MVGYSRRIGPHAFRLLAVLALLGCPRIGSAAGTWSVISLPQKLGDVVAPTAVAVDAAGDLYVADRTNPSSIQKRDAHGSWSVIATSGTAAGQIRSPDAVAIDTTGNLYIADQPVSGFINGRVQKRDAHGSWTVIATYGIGAGFSPGQQFIPSALAVDRAGNLYVADLGGDARIRERDAQGNWSVIATDGTALGQVRNPAALAVDVAGNLYVAGNNIQKRDSQGNWSVIATQGASALAVDTEGSLYVVAGWVIQKRDPDGNWSVLAQQGFGVGEVSSPSALALDADGDLFIADGGSSSGNGRIQERAAHGSWTVLATAGEAPGQVLSPSSLAMDAAGDLYVADLGYDRIKERDTQGNWSILTTVGDALGQVDGPTALAVDSAGNLYVADFGSAAGEGPGRIQKRDAQGNWSMIATGGSASGQVRSPAALAVDTAGNLYVADTDNSRIQERDARGNWSILAPEGDALGQVDNPTALAVDAGGDLYLLDYGQRIQKRDPQGNWSVIPTGDTDADQIAMPSGLAADAAGNLYIASRFIGGLFAGGTDQVQRRDAQGNWSVIATAGGALGQVINPSGLAVDTAGHLYVADTGNWRVQEYTPSGGQ